VKTAKFPVLKTRRQTQKLQLSRMSVWRDEGSEIQSPLWQLKLGDQENRIFKIKSNH